MDQITAAEAAITVWGSKDLMMKLLGPTADYVGGEAKNFVAKCNINLDRVFKKATLKLGDKIEQDGTVNPRVLKNIVDEGRFCEDELTAEYYGGILASARSGNGRDDRGVTLLATIKDLSIYQLRFHYLAYRVFNSLFIGQGFNLGDTSDCEKMTIFIPMRVYSSAMAFTDEENPSAILSHVLFGLAKHNLISSFSSGHPDFLRNRTPKITEAGIMLSPTLPGAELFLWANGLSGASGQELLQVEIVGSVDGLIVEDGSASIEAIQEIPDTQK
jgi:hypothetical protein